MSNIIVKELTGSVSQSVSQSVQVLAVFVLFSSPIFLFWLRVSFFLS